VVLCGIGGAMSLGSLSPLMTTECEEDIGGRCTHPLWRIGATMLAMGGALVVGLPLAIIGGEEEPAGGYATSEPLRIGFGVGNGTLRWRF
jgi:hypothetical protein